MKLTKEYTKNFHNLVILFVLWFFAGFTIFTGSIVCISNYQTFGTFWTPLFVFLLIFLAFVGALYIVYKIRVYQDSEKIIIYGKRLNGLKLIDAFKTGYTIKYSNILSIDLIPIRFFNRILSYQICVKTVDPLETIYINSISNLDTMFINIRAFRFGRFKDKKDENKND